MSTAPQVNHASAQAIVIEAGNERREFKSVAGASEFACSLYKEFAEQRSSADAKLLTLGQVLYQIRSHFPFGTWERHLQRLDLHVSTCRYAIKRYEIHAGIRTAETNREPNNSATTLAVVRNTQTNEPNTSTHPCHTCGKPLEPDQLKGDICSACADRGPKDDPEDDPGLDDDNWVDDGDDAGVGIAGDDEDEYGDADELDDEEFEDTVKRLHPPEPVKPVIANQEAHRPEGAVPQSVPPKRPQQLTFESVYAEAANRMTSCIQGVRAALESGTLSEGARARMEAAFKNISSEIEAAMRECGLAAPNERGA